MRFTDIQAQESAVGILTRAIAADRVPHAYLFTGPAGVGKFLAARALAMTLNCAESGEDACGECLSCRKIMRSSHPDVFVLSPPEKKKNIAVDAVRELMRRLLTRPHEGRAKVAIIDPADTMTESAANALLKTLEEPRPGAFLVLISSAGSSLLSTVRSRCQQIRFRALPTDVVETLLMDSGTSPEDAAVAASLSNGSMAQAATYLSEDLSGRMELALGLVEGSTAPTPKMGLAVAAQMAGQRNEALRLLELVMIVTGEILWLLTHPEDAGERKMATLMGDKLVSVASRLSLQKVTVFVTETHRAYQRIRNNNMNPQLALENMLMSMRGRSDCGLTGSGLGIE